ncbi:MAG: hypothetical protein ACK2U1_00755, partial [Anaerolineales bacterium]
MAERSTTAKKVPPKKRAGLSQAQRNEAITAYLFMAPAAIGLILFMVVPFLMAFYLSLTDTRLMSPNPPEFVGFENYNTMLTVKFAIMEPLTDEETGEVMRDEVGNIEYP